MADKLGRPAGSGQLPRRTILGGLCGLRRLFTHGVPRPSHFRTPRFRRQTISLRAPRPMKSKCPLTARANPVMRYLIFFLVLLAGPAALAEPRGCCEGCGQPCCLQPVCRLVCEQKTVREVCYDCRCEDFCVMGPSQKCGHVCETDCYGQSHQRILWKPSCGHVRQRHMLIKQEIAKEVPHYKCVVEYVCSSCCRQGGRLPCDHAGQLNAQAEALNAATKMPATAATTESTRPQANVAAPPPLRFKGPRPSQTSKTGDDADYRRGNEP